MGANPELEDRVPLRLMRENEIDAVAPAILNSAREFLAGGHAWEDGVLEWPSTFRRAKIRALP